jgi:hypothetical protein
MATIGVAQLTYYITTHEERQSGDILKKWKNNVIIQRISKNVKIYKEAWVNGMV